MQMVTVTATMANTAEVVSHFDDLFDSVNGTALYSNKSKGKPLRKAVTEKSPIMNSGEVQ